ncbi:hypothetical protein [Helicobacter bilis]|uniref:Uncharacterized protein n=2 Tax=Helicobacter bilis TaxID=37372 RepID=A0A6D2CAX8_9HELI|nr:hypothetical protein [Helicobacter bilis]EMZ38434.1 hypothetical protein C826_01470 [Helicobacter bilis WiWa]TLE04770.1 hypothetical protein LS77_005190 [Helicobacter bilis]TLE06039.1 hypothetical protein LS76_004165 [Helicobacter bilis]
MPLPFLVAAGIAAIGAGVGAIANETRREKEESKCRNSIESQLLSGNYSITEISYGKTKGTDSRK